MGTGLCDPISTGRPTISPDPHTARERRGAGALVARRATKLTNATTRHQTAKRRNTPQPPNRTQFRQFNNELPELAQINLEFDHTRI